MPLDALLNLLVKVSVMIALGFFLKKRGLITPQFQKDLSNFLMCAVLPFSVLASANSEFSAGLARKMGGAALISCAYYLLAFGASRLVAHTLFVKKGEPQKAGIFVTMAVFANTGFIGLPIVKELYGAEGFLYGIIYNMAYQVFLFSLGVMLLSGQKKLRLKNLTGDVVTLISIGAVLIYLSPFRFPPALEGAFNAIGDMCVPISMIVVGCCVADVRLADIWREWAAYLVSLLRLLVFPMVMLVALKCLGVDPQLSACCVLLTGLPVGSLNVIMAERYRADVGFATRAVVQSMLLFLVALPLLLLCINAWLI